MTFIYLLFLFDQELNLIKVLEVYFHEDKLSWFYLPIAHTLPQRNTDVCTRNSLSYYLDIYFYLYNLRISKKNNFPYFSIFIIYFCFVLAPIFGLLIYFESFRIYIMSFPCLVLIASLSFSQCILSVPHCLS